MDNERLIYLQAVAEDLAGNLQGLPEEIRVIGEMMLELVKEVAYLTDVELVRVGSEAERD